MKNKTLQKAKSAKKDEFYTRLEDIQNELMHYRSLFHNKCVLCNCDDPYESNFFKFFALNFNAWGLRKLIATCYNGSAIAGSELTLPFAEEENANNTPIRNAYKIEITEVPDLNGDGATNLSDVDILIRNDKNVLTRLKGNGDFRSSECTALLQEADIVVTNPPFSLLREYIKLLTIYNKKFLIIASQNVLTYQEVFPLIKENKMWLGASIHSGDRKFYVPNDYELNAAGCGQDADGRKFIRVKGVRWFTNLDYKERHEPLFLYKNYTYEAYPTYDNYDAINVNKTADIPCDYEGAMGVPITFLDKYDPAQFEILGLMASTKVDEYNFGYPYVNGKKLYARIVIRKIKEKES